MTSADRFSMFEPGGKLYASYEYNLEQYQICSENKMWGSEEYLKSGFSLLLFYSISSGKLRFPDTFGIYDVISCQAAHPLDAFVRSGKTYIDWYVRKWPADPFAPRENLDSWQHFLFGLMSVQYGFVSYTNMDYVSRSFLHGLKDEASMVNIMISTVIPMMAAKGRKYEARAGYDSLLDYIGVTPLARIAVNPTYESILRGGYKIFGYVDVLRQLMSKPDACRKVSMYLDDLSFMVQHVSDKSILEIAVHGSHCYPFLSGLHTTQVAVDGLEYTSTFSMNLQQMLATLSRNNNPQIVKTAARQMVSEHLATGARLLAI